VAVAAASSEPRHEQGRLAGEGWRLWEAWPFGCFKSLYFVNYGVLHKLLYDGNICYCWTMIIWMLCTPKLRMLAPPNIL
jgi:hypothetical protein